MNKGASARVAVLLALYNGRAYLREFLESLMEQDYSEFTLFVRDDGSQDDSVEIVKEYCGKLSIVFLEVSRQLGPARNFARLLEVAGDGFDTYMFADQDDLWLPQKIRRAWSRTKVRETACLYLSSFNCVDQYGAFLRKSRRPRVIDSKNAVVQTIGPGCGMALNGAARRLLIELEIPPGVMHDRWFYFVVSLLGDVVYDEEVTFSYRLHNNNAVGAPSGKLNSITRKLSRYFGGQGGGVYSAAAIATGALQQLDSQDLDDLRPGLMTLTNPPADSLPRLLAFLRLPFVRQSRLETELMKLALFFKAR